MGPVGRVAATEIGLAPRAELAGQAGGVSRLGARAVREPALSRKAQVGRGGSELGGQVTDRVTPRGG